MKIERLALRTRSMRLFLGAALVVAAGVALPKAGAAALASSQGGHSSSAFQIADGEPYELKTEIVGDCKVNTECVAHIRIEAKGEFHVNESYPFKFTADSPNAELHGSSGKVFTGGDFERQGKTVGVMTVKFKPTAKGPTTIAGKYKICICSEKICSPQTVDVSIPVVVK